MSGIINANLIRLNVMLVAARVCVYMCAYFLPP